MSDSARLRNEGVSTADPPASTICAMESVKSAGGVTGGAVPDARLAGVTHERS